ncbi:signal recognition particle protein [Alkalibacterium pelagium]|uniref:Signal recognition particle protein n=1 Tax=Alkalibacterium pelagium TaxID=426702 RepID=A0A1H7JVR3_9LACT|nr:signal recognition particle protein [Alkalibacterium pelagium]GEN50535.1 signal recognition particle protein [Alkalibacterium pelagium]SEK78396.1 signal recognition particle subunit FFH/SRP54 (srp54) [Alkalibacterium pelagium]
MAFEGLTGRLQDAFSGLRKKGKVTEADVKDVMREVRLALLEADVNYKVVRNFVKTVREKSLGEEVLGSLNGGQQVVKIVNDELTELMGGEQEKIIFADPGQGPTIYMMTGLQGAGKTTTAGKLANYLRKHENKKPMMVAADIYRPAAIDQLETLGRDLDIPVFSMGDQVSPVEIAEKGIQQAKDENRDVVIIDTAGRLHIDENLMNELEDVKAAVNPHEIFLVVDAMTGQDAVNVADSFNDRLSITSVILTKLDGDTRGGAALSIRSVTNKPIKFTGTGEKLEALEPFYPDRMANRILGMGDILTLIERAQQEVDEERAEEMAAKMRENRYDFNDFIEQMDQMTNMGPMEDILKMIPGMSNVPGMADFQMDPKDIAHMKAIVLSMTPEERENPDILSQKRRRRIAKGSARDIAEVNRMIKQFKQSKEMMSKMSKGNMGGMPGLDKLMGGGVKGKLGKMALNGMSKKNNKKKKKKKIRRKK